MATKHSIAAPIGTVLFAGGVFPTIIRIIDQVGRFEAVISLRPYLNFFNVQLSIICLVVGPILVWYAMRTEYTNLVKERQLAEADHPILWTPNSPWGANAEPPPRPVPQLSWRWLKILVVAGIISILAAVVVISYHNRRGPHALAAQPSSQATNNPAIDTIQAPNRLPTEVPPVAIHVKQSRESGIPNPKRKPDEPTVGNDQSAKTNSQNSTPQFPFAPQTDDLKVTVSGIVRKGEKPIVSLPGGMRFDLSSRPSGIVYVMVLVSMESRRNGAIDQSIVQSVVNSVGKMPGVKVFFSDRGYQISMAGTGTGAYGLLGALSNVPGSIYFFNQKDESVALQIKKTVETLSAVKTFEYHLPSDSDIGIGTSLQQAWKVTGIDIEIIL